MDNSIDALDADPATSYDVNAWMLLSLAYDGLTAFRRTGGRAGTQVVPNLAQALPGPVGRRDDVHVRDATRCALLDRA